ncbi:MAG TPA: signal peptidase I, partial [Candidatus Saccharimonadales bacterium]|nr:signal peptidase I [Candidatus Saccharimonadales bacterium]
MRENAEMVLFALVLTVIIRMVLLQAFRIPSASMENTLLVGDFLFVNKFLYGAKITVPFTDKLLFQLPRVRNPRVGDIIVFRNPMNTSEDYIKRCEGAPGDVIEVRSKQLYRNGRPVFESYVHHIDADTMAREVGPRDNFGPDTVQAGHYFMMGDNRDDSQDSRWFGAVDERL